MNAIAGTAEVWSDGRMVSRTPYVVRGPIGEHVSLVLRREGFEDEPIKFDITEGRSEYSVSMHPSSGNGGRSPLPPEDLPMLPALAWFGLPWRRRKTAPGPMAFTVDRPLPDAGVRAAESRMIVGVASDPGCVRDSNEDTVRVVRPSNETAQGQGLLAAVLDGMGGHAAGEVASRIAADELASRYADTKDDPGESLAEAVRAANKAVFMAASRDPVLKGMGTTCTALVVRGGMAWCAHVGDSRCYLVRGDGIFLMTEDHSAVMAMVRNGSLESRRSPPAPRQERDLPGAGKSSQRGRHHLATAVRAQSGRSLPALFRWTARSRERRGCPPDRARTIRPTWRVNGWWPLPRSEGRPTT